ncbi:hypothetical protein HZC31_06250 [Candidatus Woesearchaeota archaeon]|nr:hypothetical protein [Candidatus Woesearchaeota archaeon]
MMTLTDKFRLWTQEATHIDSSQFDLIRRIQHWDDSLWQAYSRGGHYQPTGLTAEVSHGSCSAYWLKLEPNEGIEDAQAPDATSPIFLYEGKAVLCWKDSRDNKRYSTVMRQGDKPYVLTPSEEYAIINQSDARAILLIFDTHSK